MPEISLVQTIVNGGPALIIAVGLVFVWRAWRRECTEHEAEREALRELLQEVQENRVADAERWADKYRELAQETQRTIADLSKVADLLQRFAGPGGSGGG